MLVHSPPSVEVGSEEPQINFGPETQAIVYQNLVDEAPLSHPFAFDAAMALPLWQRWSGQVVVVMAAIYEGRRETMGPGTPNPCSHLAGRFLGQFWAPPPSLRSAHHKPGLRLS